MFDIMGKVSRAANNNVTILL